THYSPQPYFTLGVGDEQIKKRQNAYRYTYLLSSYTIFCMISYPYGSFGRGACLPAGRRQAGIICGVFSQFTINFFLTFLRFNAIMFDRCR
ncbi:MAG: hypothetical protein U9R01_06330, partial [candidate division WOR-3 bacterium]|nr:hypothetical protein [candidate division WOR-3 bacterium]